MREKLEAENGSPDFGDAKSEAIDADPDWIGR